MIKKYIYKKRNYRRVRRTRRGRTKVLEPAVHSRAVAGEASSTPPITVGARCKKLIS